MKLKLEPSIQLEQRWLLRASINLHDSCPSRYSVHFIYNKFAANIICQMNVPHKRLHNTYCHSNKQTNWVPNRPFRVSCTPFGSPFWSDCLFKFERKIICTNVKCKHRINLKQKYFSPLFLCLLFRFSESLNVWISAWLRVETIFHFDFSHCRLYVHSVLIAITIELIEQFRRQLERHWSQNALKPKTWTQLE